MASSQSESQNGGSDTFYRFPLLPTETRLEIWQATWEPRLIEPDMMPNDDFTFFTVSATKADPPVTLWVNRESRNKTLEHYELCWVNKSYKNTSRIYFNFDLDILQMHHFGDAYEPKYCESDLTRLQRVAWPLDWYYRREIHELLEKPCDKVTACKRILTSMDWDYDMLEEIADCFPALEEILIYDPPHLNDAEPLPDVEFIESSEYDIFRYWTADGIAQVQQREKSKDLHAIKKLCAKYLSVEEDSPELYYFSRIQIRRTDRADNDDEAGWKTLEFPYKEEVLQQAANGDKIDDLFSQEALLWAIWMVWLRSI